LEFSGTVIVCCKELNGFHQLLEVNETVIDALMQSCRRWKRQPPFQSQSPVACPLLLTRKTDPSSTSLSTLMLWQRGLIVLLRLQLVWTPLWN